MLDKTSEVDARHQVGGNNPPAPIDFARDTIAEVNAFLTDHPTIETEDDASKAKPFLDRAKAALEAMEAERDGKVRPLNEAVTAINVTYKALHNTDAKKPGTFDKIFIELKARVGAFMVRETERKKQEAETARLALETAERVAREAEKAEADAIANAAVGEVVDVAAVTQQADEAFGEYKVASRFAARAERGTKVKVGGGFGRAVSLRTVETLHLDSYGKALKAIGPQPGIEAAILSAARDYRKQHGALPEGVTATTERKL